MSSAIAALLLLATTTQDGGPQQSCCPLRTPYEHLKIISAASCALDPDFYYGPATYGTTPTGSGNYVANNSASSPPAGTIILYCDGLLPAETTAFDYAELEYFAPNEQGNVAPTLDVYLDAEGQNINGTYTYSQTIALGSCSGPLTPLYLGTNSISTCSTSQSLPFGLDGGPFPGFWPLQDWTLFSIHYLLVIPSSPDPTQANLAYRIIEHFEAP